jgi:hypothetical protein
MVRYLDDECEGEVDKPMPLFGRLGFIEEGPPEDSRRELEQDYLTTYFIQL